jgi:hypothetical protein
VISSILIEACATDFLPAYSTNWSKIAEFSGSGSEGYYTGDFTCDRVEWRIVWNYSAYPENADSATFTFMVYPQQGGLSISSIKEVGALNTSGISYVHNQTGTFYGAVDVEKTSGYDIIIEQDLDSVPEYPTVIVFFLVVLSTLFIGFLHRRAFRRSVHVENLLGTDDRFQPWPRADD